MKHLLVPCLSHEITGSVSNTTKPPLRNRCRNYGTLPKPFPEPAPGPVRNLLRNPLQNLLPNPLRNPLRNPLQNLLRNLLRKPLRHPLQNPRAEDPIASLLGKKVPLGSFVFGMVSFFIFFALTLED